MLRPDIAALDAMRRVNAQISYDRMKTAVEVGKASRCGDSPNPCETAGPTTAFRGLPAMRRRSSMRTGTCPDPDFGRVEGGYEKSRHDACLRVPNRCARRDVSRFGRR
jgi:hypothetical protein